MAVAVQSRRFSDGPAEGRSSVLESVRAPPKKRLGEMLVDAGLVTPEQLEPAIAEAARLGRRLGEYLVDQRLVSPEDLAATLSLQLSLPIIDLKRQVIQPEALKLVPEEYARQPNG